jgi:hypothetical protein
MNLTNILKSVLNLQKKIELVKLPSMGLFYADDFEIWIKKADMADIIEYEYEFRRDDLGSILHKLKKIVERNVVLKRGYRFSDLKSVDVIFIFIEIVKFTNSKPFLIKYKNPLSGNIETIDFCSENFNYFNREIISKKWDQSTKEVIIDGYRYSLPTIGVENSITKYLISKSLKPSDIDYEKISYDFIYFLGGKSDLTNDEIDNLIQIFNFEIEEEDKKKIRKIVGKFSGLGKYSLKKDDLTIELTSNIDLEKVWK